MPERGVGTDAATSALNARIGSVDQMLRDLMTPILEGLKGDQLRRMQRAEADLRRCVESDGAVARVDPASVLLLALPRFLDRTNRQGQDDEDRRLRMRLALELARHLRRLREPDGFDTAVASAQLDRAWRSALQRLREDQERPGTAGGVGGAGAPSRRVTMEG